MSVIVDDRGDQALSGGDTIEDPGARGGARPMASGTRLIALWICRVAAVAVPLGAWQLAGDEGWLDRHLIGSPSRIGTDFYHLLGTSLLRADLKTTLVETALGFLISVVLGIVAGFLMARSAFLEQVFHPILTAMNSLPRIALAPIFLLWFGLGEESKVALIVSFVFFIITANTLAAFTATDRDRMLLARSLGASERMRMIYFVMPAAIPTLAAGLELGLVYSVLGAVIGEMIGGSQGLGVQLTLYTSQFDTDNYFAVLLVIVLITLILVQALRWTRHRLFKWQRIEMRGEHGFG